MKNNIVHEYKEEFLNEIHNSYVSVADLDKTKVPKEVLAEEVYLHKIFGDKIFINKKADEEVSGEKEIIKLDEQAILFDSEVRQICENIADDEFDANVNLFVSQISKE